MKWNLSCRKVRKSLALWSGNDLDEAGQVVVRRHLAICPHCREDWSRLQVGRQALEQARSASRESAPLTASVWPAVERQLPSLRPRGADWRAWLPTGALAAACLTLFLAIVPARFPTNGDGPGRSPLIFSQQARAMYGPDSAIEDRPPAHLDLRDTPRVRTLLDGSDARDL